MKYFYVLRQWWLQCLTIKQWSALLSMSMWCSILCLCVSCSILRQTCDKQLPSSLGGSVNTLKDETMPFVVNGYVLFSSNRPSKNKVTVFNTEYDAYLIRELSGKNTVIDVGRALPKLTVPTDGAMSSYYDAGTGLLELYGSAFLAGKAGSNADIFVIVNDNGKFSEPVPVAGINTRGWEAHPAISPDGTLLIFASDRAGGFGGADLYMSERQDDGTWSTPINMGEQINSKYDDMAPAFAADNSFYYTTKRFSKGRQFDIAFAKISEDSWLEPVLMDAPVNSTFDDMYPAVKNDTLYFSSNRPGGCGGYDLYAFPLCAQVRVRGSVISEYEQRSAGTVLVLDQKGEEYATVPLDEKQGFDIVLPSRSTFTFRYQNPCYRGMAVEQRLTTPCSSSPVALRLNLNVAEQQAQQRSSPAMEQFVMPFFSTAQFIPVSEETIGDIQLRQAYNIILGNIKEPTLDAEAQRYAKQIESTMKRIVQTTQIMSGGTDGSECSDPTPHHAVEIMVEGYADTRPFTPNAKYQGEAIADEDFGVNVNAGQRMTNELLSLLRAYYTAKMIRTSLVRVFGDTPQFRSIRFTVVGKGVMNTVVSKPTAYKKKSTSAPKESLPADSQTSTPTLEAQRKIIVSIRSL